MARQKLGNDPFQRGAANREEAAKPAEPAPEKGEGKKSRKQRRKEEKAAKQAPVETTPVAESAVEEAPVEAAPVEEVVAPVAEAPVEEAPAPVAEAPAEEVLVAKVTLETEPEPEPAPVAEEPVEAPVVEMPAVEQPVAVVAEVAEIAAETAQVPMAAAVGASGVSVETITPENAPLPATPKAERPRLRLLKFDRPEIDRTIAEAFETVEKLAEKPAAAASEEVRKAMAFLSGQLSGAEARKVANGLWSRLGHTVASASAKPAREVDAFGRDPIFEERALKVLELLYRRYFRVDAHGVANIPAEGPVILVANHSGALPWDLAMLKCAVALEHPNKRSIRPLAENFVFHFPFLGVAMNRFGAVRACQENAEALLDAGEAIAVFPEGAKGLGKKFQKRYQLQRFGRGGFVKLALRTGAPIVPVAIVGAEETHPMLGRLVRPVAPLGLPYLPITPTFPLFGALGLLPLPTKWTIEFGAPIRLEKNAAADELTVEKITEDVRSGIQGQLDRLLQQRRGVFG